MFYKLLIIIIIIIIISPSSKLGTRIQNPERGTEIPARKA